MIRDATFTREAESAVLSFRSIGGTHVLSTNRAECHKPFAVSVVQDPEGAAVIAEGELDMESADVLERKVTELRAVGARRIVIDLGGLEFMDSSGLRSLIALRNDCKRTGQELELVAGPPAVQRLFHITATRGLFHWR